jgi:ABC-2 type transport system permease protein
MTLFKQHVKTEAISTLIWAVILGLLGFMTTYMWDLLRTSGSLADLQKALENAQGIIKTLVGTDGISMLTIDGWIQGYSMGGWVSLLYVIFTALFVAGMVTREMDRRTMEFVLSLPISRAQLLLSRWLVMASSLVLLHLAQFAGVLAGVYALGAEGHPGRYAVAAVNSLLLYLFLGSLMLLVSLFIDDYGAGTGAMLGVGLGLNFAYMATADATGALKTLREVLPFSLYDVQSIVIKGTTPWGDMAVLGVGTILLLALSVWVFQRKQIAV